MWQIIRATTQKDAPQRKPWDVSITIIGKETINLKSKPFEIRRLTRHDLPAFSALIHVFNLVFEEPVTAIGSEVRLQKLLNNNNFIAMAAVVDNEVV